MKVFILIHEFDNGREAYAFSSMRKAETFEQTLYKEYSKEFEQVIDKNNVYDVVEASIWIDETILE